MNRCVSVVLIASVLTACAPQVAGDGAGPPATPPPLTHVTPTGTPPATAPAPAAATDPARAGAATTAAPPAGSPARGKEQTEAPPAQRRPDDGTPDDGPDEERPGRSDTPTATTTDAAVPLEPGTYTYDTEGSMTVTGGTPRRLPDTTSLTAGGPRGPEQVTIRDLRDEQGRGQVTETTLLYRDDGVFLAHVKVISQIGGGLSDVREWTVDPPALLAATSARPGDRSEFTMRGADTTAEVRVELLRQERLSIGGQRIDTIVTRIRIEVSGAIEGSQTTTAWVRPTDLLTVREEVDSDFTNGALSVQTSYQATLARLPPS